MPARFFQAGKWNVGDQLLLEREESHHAARVLRLSEGDSIEIFNGEGLIGSARIESQERDRFRIQIQTASATPNPWKMTLAFSLGKPPVTEFILKRVTELGVRRFQPLKTRYSHPGDFKIERWHKILLEVCKQCQETHVPLLEPIQSLESWLESWKPRPLLLCDEQNRAAKIEPSFHSEVAILVGAEGGWDRQEVSLLESQSALHLGLGRNRLRAETAALTAAVLTKRSLGEIP